MCSLHKEAPHACTSYSLLAKTLLLGGGATALKRAIALCSTCNGAQSHIFCVQATVAVGAILVACMLRHRLCVACARMQLISGQATTCILSSSC